MKGKYPVNYFKNPYMDKEKSIEQIWDDIEAYSGEFFEDEPNYHAKIDFFVPLPPLCYKGKATKGIFFSQGTEYILKLYPQLQEIFFACAYTMWSSYSWCDKADCYLTCYENKPREAYYKRKYPNKKDIIFIPLQDADFCNEYYVAPTPNTPKTIDVLVVSTPIQVKNLPMIAEAIKLYEKKYNYRLKTTIALGTNGCEKREDGTLDYSSIDKKRIEVLDEVNSILYGKMDEYINFEPYIKHNELSKYYTGAKCTVLASLIEGKNRGIFESISCDTPVVVFRDHNKWARGNYPIFWGNSGEYVPEFTAESLADTIHKVINNGYLYEPRKNHLMHSGRKNFIDICADYIPYYRDSIPGYEEGRFHENLWVDLACQRNYQLSYIDFLYGRNAGISHVRGLENIEKLVKFYYSRFNIN